MFLKSIKLQNFKGFDDLDLNFTSENKARKLTLLLGQNGTGKSNVLKAIAMVTAGSDALLELVTNPDDWVKFGEKEARISAVLVTKDNEERPISLTIPLGANRSELLRLNTFSLKELDSALRHTERNYFIAGYGASRRLNNEDGFRSSKENFRISNRVANVFTLFNPEARLNSLSSWAMSLDYRSGGKELAVVKNTLNYFLEGFKFHAIDKENKTLLFKEGKHVIKLESLSDGYQNMASWVGDMLYRLTETFNDYKSPLQARGVLLIDEIDLHLHPKWQRKLLDFIQAKLPNMQVIATTHSPLTAQQAGEGELFALNRQAGKTALVPFVGNPKQMLVNQMLMSPVFGLETDESFEVQNLKKEYKSLQSKARPTASDEQKLDRVKEKLKDVEVQRPNSLLSSSDKDLLRDIRKAVSKDNKA